MSGQSVMDRLTAAKHSIAGQGLAKSVCKATTEEVMGPKKKHLDYLVACTNEPNVSIPQLANLLIERTQNTNWTIVFKSLVTVHNLMNYGNERFTQFLASNNCTFQLTNFIDKTGVQGYDMSTFIRRYAKYLNEKAVSYRLMAFDFCKVKRGKEDGLLRTMNGEKLLKTLPTLQVQLDALLEFDCSPNDLTNGVINATFMLLFKDLIRLFACYNDGIINLLEKYFEMNKKQCKEALDIYKKFLVRMDKVSEMLKVAENVGIDKGDIPDLAKGLQDNNTDAPSSLLDALEQHLASVEGKKVGTTVKPAGMKNAIDGFAKASTSASQISEAERQKILEEENIKLQELKEKKAKEEVTTLPSPEKPVVSPSGSTDLFGATPAPIAAAAPANASDDLLSLATAPDPMSVQQQQPQQPPPQQQPQMAQMNAFGGAPPAQTTNPFGAPSAGPWGASGFSGGTMVNHTTQPPPGFDGFGELLKPEAKQTAPTQFQTPEQKLIAGGLDTSLASLAGNLNIKGAAHQVKKAEHQWKPSTEKKITGGTTYTQPFVSSGPTIPQMSSQQTFQPAPMMAPNPVMGGMGAYPTPGYAAPAPYQMNGWMTQPTASSGFAQPGMGMAATRAMGQTAAFGAQQGMMGQPRPSQPNDPFGAL